MDWKTRLLTAMLMTLVMVAVVTFIATFLALGFDRGFLLQWGKAYAVAWPIAAVTGFLVMPAARLLADRIVLHLGR
jgi:hypothetical protein